MSEPADDLVGALGRAIDAQEAARTAAREADSEHRRARESEHAAWGRTVAARKAHDAADAERRAIADELKRRGWRA